MCTTPLSIAGRSLGARKDSLQIVALKPWFEKQPSMIARGWTFAEDVRYALDHWAGLTRFFDDGHIKLDTKPVENAVRPICLTRKTRSLPVKSSEWETGPCSHPS